MSIVLTMSSNGVDEVTKEMNLKNIDFSNQVLSNGDVVFNENETILYPNPLSVQADLSFYSEIATSSKIEIYNLSGALIKSIPVEAEIGNNKITVFREGLKSGLYLMKLSNKFRNYKTMKLVVN